MTFICFAVADVVVVVVVDAEVVDMTRSFLTLVLVVLFVSSGFLSRKLPKR